MENQAQIFPKAWCKELNMNHSTQVFNILSHKEAKIKKKEEIEGCKRKEKIFFFSSYVHEKWNFLFRINKQGGKTFRYIFLRFSSV